VTTADETTYELTLYVSGASDLSGRAIDGARRLCEHHLQQRCDLTIVDVHDDPAAVLADGVLVTPTLVRHRPLPVRMYAGDVGRTDEVLLALELDRAAGPPDARPGAPQAPTATRVET
jgi:circadian clock protein KaiB